MFRCFSYFFCLCTRARVSTCWKQGRRPPHRSDVESPQTIACWAKMFTALKRVGLVHSAKTHPRTHTQIMTKQRFPKVLRKTLRKNKVPYPREKTAGFFFAHFFAKLSETCFGQTFRASFAARFRIRVSLTSSQWFPHTNFTSTFAHDFAHAFRKRFRNRSRNRIRNIFRKHISRGCVRVCGKSARCSNWKKKERKGQIFFARGLVELPEVARNQRILLNLSQICFLF